eukprot:1120496-Rhodomonas_salina.5
MFSSSFLDGAVSFFCGKRKKSWRLGRECGVGPGKRGEGTGRAGASERGLCGAWQRELCGAWVQPPTPSTTPSPAAPPPPPASTHSPLPSPAAPNTLQVTLKKYRALHRG